MSDEHEYQKHRASLREQGAADALTEAMREIDARDVLTPTLDTEIDRILSMSDDEILAEVRAEGRDPDDEARQMAEQFNVIARLVNQRDKARRLMGAAWERNAIHTKELATLHTEIARLRSVIDHEAPIAAFDLATTWRAERAAYQEEIGNLRATLIRIHEAAQSDAEWPKLQQEIVRAIAERQQEGAAE